MIQSFRTREEPSSAVSIFESRYETIVVISVNTQIPTAFDCVHIHAVNAVRESGVAVAQDDRSADLFMLMSLIGRLGQGFRCSPQNMGVVPFWRGVLSAWCLLRWICEHGLLMLQDYPYGGRSGYVA